MLNNNNDVATDDPLVRIRGVTFRRGGRLIFDNVDLDLPRGGIIGIMGPSGCGKTTLLRLIGGQLRPASGSIEFDGMVINRLRRSQLFEARKRMGMLFQSGALLTDMNLFDNIAFPMREHTGLPESMIHDLVIMKLEAVGLRGARSLMPSELSGGMARRAALARAIALDPAMIMYDEPFTGQDPISMGVLIRLIKHTNEALGLTSIVVSHDVAETASIADYIYVLSDGKVVGQGTADEIRDSESEWVRQFMDAKPDGPVPFHYPAPAFDDDLLAGRDSP